MKTDDLIAMLSRGDIAAATASPRAQFGAALGWGAFGATLLLAVFLGVRPDLLETAVLPMFWIKLAFPALLLALALPAAQRLARPGGRLHRLPGAAVGVVVAMWVLAAASLLAAQPEARAELLLGDTWLECPASIGLLAVPAFVVLFRTMREFAPTELRRAGAAAGFSAGTLGAVVYSLHCHELAAPFVATWYLLGMLIPAALGWVLGPRLLRW